MFRTALARAETTTAVRPFHDGRHAAITNDAAAGNSPIAVMKRAGYSNFKTTQTYIDLAGQMFREEAERLEARLSEIPVPRTGTKTPLRRRPRRLRSRGSGSKQEVSSGGGGIRTHGALSRPSVFKTDPFGRSGTPPELIVAAAASRAGRAPVRRTAAGRPGRLPGSSRGSRAPCGRRRPSR